MKTLLLNICWQMVNQPTALTGKRGQYLTEEKKCSSSTKSTAAIKAHNDRFICPCLKLRLSGFVHSSSTLFYFLIFN